MTRVLSDAERIAWLRLARTEGVGSASFAHILARTRDIFEALDAVPRLARRGGADIKIASAEAAKRELDALARAGGRLIASCETDFPAALAAVDPPPPVLSVLGDARLFAREAVAVVGARNASALGIKFAGRIAEDLGRAGFVVVSGMARGIDGAAHRRALATGTIAVLAGGVDVVYPPENRSLHEQLCAVGAVVSEMPFGAEPLPRHFPRRNRIISGLARGVVVVEAAERSGSLITANYALEQGREVFAVPGSPLDPRARGSNRLIREGALLTESAEDVVAALTVTARAPDFRSAENGPAPRLAETGDDDAARARIAGLLGPSPVEMDELIRQSGAPPEAVLTIVLEFELAGRLTRHPGNRLSWR